MSNSFSIIFESCIARYTSSVIFLIAFSLSVASAQENSIDHIDHLELSRRSHDAIKEYAALKLTFAYMEDYKDLQESKRKELSKKEVTGIEKLSNYVKQIERNENYIDVDTSEVIKWLEIGWPYAKEKVYDEYRSNLRGHYSEYKYIRFEPKNVNGSNRRFIAIEELQEVYNSELQSSIDSIVKIIKATKEPSKKAKSNDSKITLQKIISGEYWWLFPLFSISVILNVFLLFNRQRKNYRSDSYKRNHSRNRSGDPDLIQDKNAIDKNLKNENKKLKERNNSLNSSVDEWKEKYEEKERSYKHLEKLYQEKINRPVKASQGDNYVPPENRISDNTPENNPVRQRQLETGANRPSDASCVTYYFEFPVKGGILQGFSKEKNKRSLYKTIFNERENTGSLELILPATSSVLDSPEFFFQHACRYSNAPFPSMNEIRQRENGLGQVEKKDDKWVVTKPIEVEFL